MAEKLSRRGFLKAAGAALGGGLLAACAPQAPNAPISPGIPVTLTPAEAQKIVAGLTPEAQATLAQALAGTPTVAATAAVEQAPATAAPTAAPTETSIPKTVIDGVGEVTQNEAALFNQATADYKAAYFMKGDQQVSLKTEKLSGTNADIVTTDTGVPLMIKGADGVWRQPGSKDLARQGFNVGSEINAWTGPNLTNPRYVEVFSANYNTATPAGYIDEGFYSKIPQGKKLTPDQVIQAYDWNQFNKLMSFLQKNSQIPVTVMHLFNGSLFRHDNAPEWMRQMSDDELLQWQVKHMETIAASLAKYGIQPAAVSVYNELFWHDKSKTSPQDVWMEGDYLYSRLHDKAVQNAFGNAERLFPNATRFMNDDNSTQGEQTHTPFNGEAQAEFNYITRMRNAGVSIGGYGEQGHLLARNFVAGARSQQDIDARINAYKADLDKKINAYKQAGVKFQITELDVNVGGLPAEWTRQQKEELKAKLYVAVYETALNSGWCNDVTTWGFSDASTWVLTNGYPYGQGETPLPFDKNFKPSMSQFEIQKALLAHRQ